MILVFDIECDGLLDELSRVWLLTAIDVATGTKYQFEEGDLGWISLFNSARAVVGHNIIAYDLVALDKVYNFKLNNRVKIIDTLIFSQILNYRRFGDKGHSLDTWGEALGIPKPEHEDWSQFSEAMRHRNEQDVKINVQVYKILWKEYNDLKAKKPALKHYIQAEHAAAIWNQQASTEGWPFDLEGAKALHAKLSTKVSATVELLESRLGKIVEPVDKVKGEVIPKIPKFTKTGNYDHHTAKWFGFPPELGQYPGERPVVGPYSRITIRDLSLGSVADVKTFLFRNGWVPSVYNTKTLPDGSKINTSPKIVEEDLQLLGGDGKLYAEYLTDKSRLSIVENWIKHTDERGRLRGSAFLIGTPSMRARHQTIVNVPSADAAWGADMRKLFTTLPGWSLIGCDSSGNQARGLAHYLQDEDYIDILINGDIHQYNADILTEIVKGIFRKEIASGAKGLTLEDLSEYRVSRGAAKRILYAFLFGASGGTLWSYIFGVVDDDRGRKLKNAFIKAVPGFKNLLDKLKEFYSKTLKRGDGFIPSIVGNRIYVDSYHKLLVYLLQSLEKITCSTALMLTVQELKSRNIPYIPCIYYHDEIDFLVPDQYAEEAAEIGKRSFKEGPKLYGIEIMDGDAKIGRNWLEVH